SGNRSRRDFHLRGNRGWHHQGGEIRRSHFGGRVIAARIRRELTSGQDRLFAQAAKGQGHMTGSMNWVRVKNRAQMQRQGVEDKKGAEISSFNLLLKNRPKRPKPSKAEQRAEAEKALAEWRARKS